MDIVHCSQLEVATESADDDTAEETVEATNNMVVVWVTSHYSLFDMVVNHNCKIDSYLQITWSSFGLLHTTKVKEGSQMRLQQMLSKWGKRTRRYIIRTKGLRNKRPTIIGILSIIDRKSV